MIYKLGDLIAINPKISLSKGKKARKIAMEDITPFTRDIGSYSFTEYKGGTKFQNGDTLLVRITPCLENGKTAFVNILKDDEVAFGSTEYFVLRAKEKVMDPYYLYYLVTTSAFRKVAIKSMTGTSGRQRAQKEAIENFNLDLPSLIEQKRIAYKLKILDDKIALNKQINANLTKLRNLQYRQLINSNTVRKVKITELFNIFYGKSLPKSKLINSGIQVFGANGLMGYTSEPSIIEKPTVTITSRGSGSGYVSYLDVGKAFLTNNLLYLDDKNNLGLSFAFEAIKAANPNQFVTGSAQPQLTIKNLSGLDIAAPVDRDAIDEFRKEMHPIESMMRNNNSENYQLEHLKDTLLCKYF